MFIGSNVFVFVSASTYAENADGGNLLSHNLYMQTDEPEFVGQVPNITVSVGRDAKFPCIVNNLDTYRVSPSMESLFLESIHDPVFLFTFSIDSP